MKQSLPLYLALALASLGAAPYAFGDGNPDGAYLGVPALGGTGCPAGTASAVLSPDAKSLSILFDSYQVQAGGTTGQQLDRKACSLGIPLHVPQGYTVSILEIDFRGFNALPAGASSQFNVEYFFAGSQGPGFAKQFNGPVSGDFELNNQVVAQSAVWSPCGEDVTLRTDTSMMVTTNASYQQTMATVDSADIKESVVFALQWRQCGGPGPQPQPQPYPPQPTPDPWDPGSYQGNCSIVQNPANPYQFFVRDINQNLIGTAPNYPQAVQIAEQADASGRCLAPPPHPYPGQPQPYPPYPGPQPYPGQPRPPVGAVSCTVSTSRGIFSGTGSSQGQAAAAAKDACLRVVNNSNICNAGIVSCR